MNPKNIQMRVQSAIHTDTVKTLNVAVEEDPTINQDEPRSDEVEVIDLEKIETQGTKNSAFVS